MQTSNSKLASVDYVYEDGFQNGAKLRSLGPRRGQTAMHQRKLDTARVDVIHLPEDFSVYTESRHYSSETTPVPPTVMEIRPPIGRTRKAGISPRASPDNQESS